MGAQILREDAYADREAFASQRRRLRVRMTTPPWSRCVAVDGGPFECLPFHVRSRPRDRVLVISRRAHATCADSLVTWAWNAHLRTIESVMNRVVSIMLAVVAVAGSLAACGTHAESGPGAEAPPRPRLEAAPSIPGVAVTAPIESPPHPTIAS